MSSLNDYEILKRLGEGSFSNVYLVKNKRNNLIYALKKVEISKLTPNARENSLNEIRILASINHENIISFIDSFYTNSENNQNYLNIILEYADDGDLESKIKNQKKIKQYFEEKLIWSIFIQIVFGLNFLHKKNIMHRDLKSANIFLMKNGKIKLGDLNVAKVIQEQEVLRTQTGTPYYASPEIWEDKPYSFKSDIWSIGIILYQMAALKMPFNGKNINEVYYNLSHVKMQELPNIYSENLSLMIKKILKKDPNERPSCDEILEDKIIKEKIRELFNDNKNDVDIEKKEKVDLDEKAIKVNKKDINLKKYNNELNIDNSNKKKEENNNLLIFKKYDNNNIDNINNLYINENNDGFIPDFTFDTKIKNNKNIFGNENPNNLHIKKTKSPIPINHKPNDKFTHKITAINTKSNMNKNHSHVLITTNDKNSMAKNIQKMPRSCLSAKSRIAINNKNEYKKIFKLTKKKTPLNINTCYIANKTNIKNKDKKEITKIRKLSFNINKKLNDNIIDTNNPKSLSPSPIPNDNYDLIKSKYIVNSFLNDNRNVKKNMKKNIKKNNINIKRQKININKINSLKKVLKPNITELYTLNDFSSFNNNNSNINKNMNLETNLNKKNTHSPHNIINNYKNKKLPLEKIKNNYCVKKEFSCRNPNYRKKFKTGLYLPIIKRHINEHLGDYNTENKEEIEPTKKMLINPIKIIEKRSKLNLHSINLQVKVNINNNENGDPSSTRDVTNIN